MSESWFGDRTWSVSVNKDGETSRIAKENKTTVIFPKSIDEISRLLCNNKEASVAVVCGGHSSSNVATWPFLINKVADAACAVKHDTIILDMKDMSSVKVNRETSEVTVGGGVLFRQLAEICAKEKSALPIGTGDTVGVCGYVLNGGIFGYFGKRLGMLGQRVTQMTIVLADGSIKLLSKESVGEDADLFYACLGAGSAMGVVASLTLKMEDESSFQTGGSVVCACSDKETARPYLEKALRFMKEYVLITPSVSMEIVVTSDYTVICSFVFYDSFDCVPDTFVQPLRDEAKAYNMPIVADGVSSHKSWFDAASSLWEVIGGMKGNPLVRLDHCIGTKEIPNDDVLDFILDNFVGDFLAKAPLSLVEIRSLGGAMLGNKIPSGNSECRFFADMIVSYDGSTLSNEEKSSILSEVHGIIAEAKKRSGVMVDFSGTHCQSDDPSELLPSGGEVFGSKENHKFIQTTKGKNDPNNRFRFHPFAHLV